MKCEDLIGVVEWDETEAQFIFESEGRGLFVNTVKWAKIIGNKYENPELIQETKYVE